jgi:invasion protein IalB
MKALALTLTALAAAAAFAPAPAAAQPAAPAAGSTAAPDPNEIICRSEQAIGSRLRWNRVCATRGQWLEHIREDRQLAERAQTSRTYCGGICTRWMTHGR